MHTDALARQGVGTSVFPPRFVASSIIEIELGLCRSVSTVLFIHTFSFETIALNTNVPLGFENWTVIFCTLSGSVLIHTSPWRREHHVVTLLDDTLEKCARGAFSERLWVTLWGVCFLILYHSSGNQDGEKQLAKDFVFCVTLRRAPPSDWTFADVALWHFLGFVFIGFSMCT